jgi:hypothetical protein
MAQARSPLAPWIEQLARESGGGPFVEIPLYNGLTARKSVSFAFKSAQMRRCPPAR